MSRVAVRPYLVTKSEEGSFRITVRDTRYNSQGYPLVSTEVLDGAFPTATAAKAYIRERFMAEPADIVTK